MNLAQGLVLLALGAALAVLFSEVVVLSRQVRRDQLRILGLVRALEHRAVELQRIIYAAYPAGSIPAYSVADQFRMMAADLHAGFPEFFTLDARVDAVAFREEGQRAGVSELVDPKSPRVA